MTGAPGIAHNAKTQDPATSLPPTPLTPLPQLPRSLFRVFPSRAEPPLRLERNHTRKARRRKLPCSTPLNGSEQGEPAAAPTDETAHGSCRRLPIPTPQTSRRASTPAANSPPRSTPSICSPGTSPAPSAAHTPAIRATNSTRLNGASRSALCRSSPSATIAIAPAPNPTITSSRSKLFICHPLALSPSNRGQHVSAVFAHLQSNLPVTPCHSRCIPAPRNRHHNALRPWGAPTSALPRAVDRRHHTPLRRKIVHPVKSTSKSGQIMDDAQAILPRWKESSPPSPHRNLRNKERGIDALKPRGPSDPGALIRTERRTMGRRAAESLGRTKAGGGSQSERRRPTRSRRRHGV